jgi:RsiW-degrading membrane proteinase PrsW (M82 family)
MMLAALPALVPALLALFLVWRIDRTREPLWLVVLTFAFGTIAALAATVLEEAVARFTDLELDAAHSAGVVPLIFFMGISAPLREACKVAACWPAFRSRHFDEPYDGVVYASSAALGFSMVDVVAILRHDGVVLSSYLRALLSLPASLFFACVWGYALGRVRQSKRPGAEFPAAWLFSTVAHGFYLYLLRARAASGLLATMPLLVVMGLVAAFAARDLRARGASLTPDSGGAASSQRSLEMAKRSLVRGQAPIRWGWIATGMLTTLGTMLTGLVSSVLLGNWLGIDFSTVNDADLRTFAPALLVVAGLLAAFPVGGFLTVRASQLGTMLEPAVAAALAILFVLALLGFSSPAALAFGVAFAPVAWLLACGGAWVAR